MTILRASVVVLAALAASGPLRAQSESDRYNIMKPEPGSARGTIWEPWLAPKYKSPRGARQRVVTPPPQPDEPRRIPSMPPPTVSPRTGQALPNIAPPIPGSGVGGRETFQDRAARCTHQAGMYGAQAGSNYLGTCVNQ
jgi:hypothetical protein